MAQLNFMNFLAASAGHQIPRDLELRARALTAAAAGQPTTRKLTTRDLEIIAKYKTDCRNVFQPPCKCEICLRQYRTKDEQKGIPGPYEGQTEDPASLAASYVNSIREDREFLHQRIIASGPALLKRWRSGEAKRKQYLEKAQPDIYPFSQPVIEVASRARKGSEIRKYKNAYLLPYVNIEDLSKNSANLLRLLHNRTVFLPQDWVHFDNAQLQPGWKQGGFREKSAEGCIIMQGEHFGKWTAFDRQAVHYGHAYGAIRGLIILEAQQVLMNFLRGIVIKILNDANTPMPQESQSKAPVAFSYNDLTSCSKWMRFIEAEPHRDQAWLSTASAYSQQPYSAPACFNIDAMIEIAETKALEAVDELWLLQTDLDYAHDLLKRHEREWLDSVPGMEELKRFSPQDKMDNIGYIMTVKAVNQAREWQWLLEECQTVKSEAVKSEAKVRPGEPLPVGYERALSGLHYLLWQAQYQCQVSLSKLFMKSPAFQSIMEVRGLGEDHKGSWALGFNYKNYSQLYQEDRMG